VLIEVLGPARARTLGLNADLAGVSTTPAVTDLLRGVPFHPRTVRGPGGVFGVEYRFVGYSSKAEELQELTGEEEAEVAACRRDEEGIQAARGE
jgi:hypothetical protein